MPGKSDYWKLSFHSNENWNNFSESKKIQAPSLQNVDLNANPKGL